MTNPSDQKQFKNSCNCGAYNDISRQDSQHPHLPWCFQYDEWEAWRLTLEQEAAKR